MSFSAAGSPGRQRRAHVLSERKVGTARCLREGGRSEELNWQLRMLRGMRLPKCLSFHHLLSPCRSEPSAGVQKVLSHSRSPADCPITITFLTPVSQCDCPSRMSRPCPILQDVSRINSADVLRGRCRIRIIFRGQDPNDGRPGLHQAARCALDNIHERHSRTAAESHCRRLEWVDVDPGEPIHSSTSPSGIGITRGAKTAFEADVDSSQPRSSFPHMFLMRQLTTRSWRRKPEHSVSVSLAF
jgi:hypothetical protein